jgi:hypothetical protein
MDPELCLRPERRRILEIAAELLVLAVTQSRIGAVHSGLGAINHG